MYCKFCGNEIADDVKFCPKCGSMTERAGAPAVDDVFAAPTAEPTVDPIVEHEKNSHATKSLVFGILSLAIGSILGLIFALIGRSNAKKFSELNHGSLEGKAKVGNILSIIGIPVSIVSFFANILYSTILTEMINEMMQIGM